MPSPFDSFQIDPDVAKAWTLPTFLYTDETVFAAEKQKIFARTWQVVGHASQVANPGDFFTTELVGEPLLFAGWMASCAGSTTCAGIVQGLRQRDVGRASCFAVDITGGPTDSTAR